MAILYNGLWKLMIDKVLQKKDLIENLKKEECRNLHHGAPRYGWINLV